MLTISVLLTLAVASQAAPTANIGSSSLSASVVFQANYVRNGTAELLKSYAKHGLHPSEPSLAAVLNDLAKRQGTVATLPLQNYGYLTPTSVGGQTLNLVFDTGSADFWVFSSELPTSSQKGHHIYNPAKSKTFKRLKNYVWSIGYGAGTGRENGASGDVGTDIVKVGGITVEQSIELAKQVTPGFVKGTLDGVVGLSPSVGNDVLPEPQLTFFENQLPNLNPKLFTAYLPPKGDGAFDFGHIDPNKYTGTIQYVDLYVENALWEVVSTSYKVGSTVYSLPNFTALVDTGTSLLLMGKSAVDTYYSQVQGATYDKSQQGYTFPCSATLPSLSLQIGSTYYAEIPGPDMNFAPIGGGKCFGSLQTGSGTRNVYGDTFFNKYYVVFQAATAQLGFAPIKF